MPKREKSCAARSGMIICRCEEVTEEEILKAIYDGARTVAGVKRRTRAGMGLSPMAAANSRKGPE